MRLTTTVTCVFPLVLASTLLGSSECSPVTETTAHGLAQYVHDKFRFPSTTVIEVGSSELIGESCYRKMHFRSTGPSGPADIALFLSPDQRFLSHELLDSTVNAAQEPLNEQRRIEADVANGNFPTRGPQEAPITITLFEDFQCPFCRQEANILKQVFDEADVRIVFRHFPLPMHPWARAAAEMAACVYQQSNEAFWAVHDSLFGRQDEVTSVNVGQFIENTIGKRNDVDLGTYEECITGHKAASQVDQDVAFAMDHDVRGTPTLFVNGIRREGVMNTEEILDLIHLAASKAKSPGEK